MSHKLVIRSSGLTSVWVSSGCCNKSTVDKVAYKQRFISHNFGGWMSEFSVLEQSDSGEGPLVSCRLLTSCVLEWQKELASSLTSS